MGCWITYSTCQPFCLVSHARVLAFPKKIPCSLTFSICLISFWASFPSSFSLLSLIYPPVACPCPFFSTLQCPVYCDCLCIRSVPVSLLFVTVCFAEQRCCGLKMLHSLLNTDVAGAPNNSLTLTASQSASYFLYWRSHWRRKPCPLKRWIIIFRTSQLYWKCSLWIAAVSPHELIVCCWQCGSSSWLSERFFRQKQYHTHTLGWCWSFQATAALAPTLTPCFKPL